MRPAAAAENQIRAWGDNQYGSLGDGTNNDSNKAVAVHDFGTVKRVDGGCGHSVALKTDGTLSAWGANEVGQLGTVTNNFYTNTPVDVSHLTKVSAISSKCLHNLALKEDGTVWAWGNNETGQLGNGTSGLGDPAATPNQVSNLGVAKAVAAGGGFSLALKEDGTVRAWGDNNVGQLGDGTNTPQSNTPVQVSGLTDVKAIAAGMHHSLALKADGTVRAWGSNVSGPLGDGTNNNSNTPVKVKNLTGIKAIAASMFHSVVLKDDGTVLAFGFNNQGQLGDGTNTDRNTPVAVKTAGGVPLTGIKSIGAAQRHNLALK